MHQRYYEALFSKPGNTNTYVSPLFWLRIEERDTTARTSSSLEKVPLELEPARAFVSCGNKFSASAQPPPTWEFNTLYVGPGSEDVRQLKVNRRLTVKRNRTSSWTLGPANNHSLGPRSRPGNLFDLLANQEKEMREIRVQNAMA